jgi:uncharacterized protein YuzE
MHNNRSPMSDPQIRYDEPSDTLYIAFEPGRPATGVALSEDILLRVDKARGTAVGLSIFNFSVLAQHTEMGPRSVPLTGLAEVSPEVWEMALRILQEAPVRRFLTLSAYAPGGAEPIPITQLKPEIVPSRAA